MKELNVGDEVVIVDSKYAQVHVGDKGRISDVVPRYKSPINHPIQPQVTMPGGYAVSIEKDWHWIMGSIDKKIHEVRILFFLSSELKLVEEVKT